jgi:N-acetylglucosamine kinase-like BadF-type ATPase
MAGADWPDDFQLYRSELSRRFQWSSALHVSNDALAGVWTGVTPGIGVSISCGTWNALGARSDDGVEWHSSFWCEPSGAAGIAADAFTAMIRSELGIAEARALTTGLLAEYRASDPAELLRFVTQRAERTSVHERARAATVVLRLADDGDPTAVAIIRRHGAMLGDYGAAAARQVGLAGRSFHLTLTGGLFQHPTDLLFEAVVARMQMLEPGIEARRASLLPAAGAVLLALHKVGIAPDPATVAALRSTQSRGS